MLQKYFFPGRKCSSSKRVQELLLTAGHLEIGKCRIIQFLKPYLLNRKTKHTARQLLRLLHRRMIKFLDWKPGILYRSLILTSVTCVNRERLEDMQQFPLFEIILPKMRKTTKTNSKEKHRESRMNKFFT